MNQVLIGFAGRKFAGKDTAAEALDGFVPFKCASTLKEMTRTFLRKQGVREEMVERLVEGDLKETPMPFFGKLSTCRELQQKLGTEFGREILGENIWINNELSACADVPRVVFTDVRFDNECESIKSKGGFMIRVSRKGTSTEFSDHPSETAIDTLDVDYEITNNGTIEELHAHVRMVLLEIELEVSMR